MLSETLVSTPPALFDTPAAIVTALPKQNPQQLNHPASPRLPPEMTTPTATRASNSPTSHRSQDWLSSEGAVSGIEAQSCRCIQKGVILLEEAEDQTRNFDPASIDSALAYLKGALETCSSMLRCQNCAVCVEIAMLLTLVASKLSQLCEKMVSQLSQQSQRLQISCNQQQARGWFPESGERSRVDAPRQNVFLGDYEINSLMEWVSLMKGLIMVQFKGLVDLVAQMKRKQPGLSGPQLTKLGNMEREIRKLVARLQGCEIKL